MTPNGGRKGPEFWQNYMTTRWGVQVVELEQRIEVLKECREAQAELGQAVAQRRGGGLT